MLKQVNTRLFQKESLLPMLPYSFTQGVCVLNGPDYSSKTPYSLMEASVTLLFQIGSVVVKWDYFPFKTYTPCVQRLTTYHTF